MEYMLQTGAVGVFIALEEVEDIVIVVEVEVETAVLLRAAMFWVEIWGVNSTGMTSKKCGLL
jgi:hypothetical protein